MAMDGRLVRKSAYGRTMLFLPERDVLFREIKCMGGLARRDTASVYHMLPAARDESTACCWHCCDAVDEPIPLPRMYDTASQVYHVYGRCCSPGCAKAYILEHTTFDRGHHLNVLVRMLRDVYGHVGPVVESPPRPALKKFGGVLEVQKRKTTRCTLVEPPFVSYCMLVDEQRVETFEQPPEEADTFDEPLPPALFTDFAKRENDASSAANQSSSAVSRKRPRRGDAKPPSGGPMSQWLN